MSILKKLFKNKERKIDKDYSELIFRLYYPTAYKASYYYCGDASIAEEAAQEAIFKAIQHIDQLRNPDKLEAWIKRIAVNNTSTILRRKAKTVSIENITINENIENTPEYILDCKETVETISQAIDTLDPVKRQVIYLRYHEEMKIKDIALLMKKPEGTIKTLLHRSKNLIKTKLVQEGLVEPFDCKKGDVK